MPTIAYISQEFPGLTTTFVYREVLALRQRGLTVRVISTWPPRRESLSAEARALLEDTFYIFPVQWLVLLRLHLRYAFTRPLAYMHTLLQATVFNRDSVQNRRRSLGHFTYAVIAAAEVEACGAQHIHADFALNAASVALAAAWLTGRPFSFAAHAADLFINPILLREKIAAAAFITPISEFNRRYLAGFAADARAASKMYVVHCGLPLSQFVPPAHRPRNARPIIVTVGRLIEKKGTRYLVEACRLLRDRNIDFDCRIVGEGLEHEALRAQIEAHQLEAQVTLLGALPQERVRELLRQADVFALPCVVGRDRDQDGIPVALMEAMALRLPVVSTSLSGIPELIGDGVTGLLTPPGDSAALADALARLLTDTALAEQLAAAGRAVIEREFNVERNADQLASLFADRRAGREPFDSIEKHDPSARRV